MATRSTRTSVPNPFAIPSTQMTGLRNYMPAPYNPTAGLADLIRMQAAMARASGGGGGGGGAGGYNPRYTRMVKVPKGDGTFIDVPVTGPTQKERDAEATRMIKAQQDAILEQEKPLQEALSKLPSLSAQGQKEEIDKIRKEMMPRLTQITGMSAEQLSTRILEKPLQEQKAREKLVNEGYIGRSLLDGAKMAFGSIADAISSIGKTSAEKLSIGQARAAENQKIMEANPYLDEQRRLAREGRSSLGYTWSNAGTAAASMLAQAAPIVAPTVALTAIGGPVGAAAGIGIGALGSGAMAGGEALSRVAEDPNLTIAQKLSAIDDAQTKAAVVGGVMGGLPVGPLGALRYARQGLRAVGPGMMKSVREQVLDNAALGAGYQMGSNWAYGSATGQSVPITEGALASALAGGVFGVPFGIYAGRQNNRLRAQRAVAEENARLNAPVETPVPEVPNYTVDPNFGLQVDTARRVQGDAALRQWQAQQAAAAYEQTNNAMARDWLGGNLGAYGPLPPAPYTPPPHAPLTPPTTIPARAPLATPEVTNPYGSARSLAERGGVPLFNSPQLTGNIPGLPRVIPERTTSVRSSRTLEERGGTPLFDTPPAFDTKSFDTSIRKSNSGNANERSYTLTRQALDSGATPEDIQQAITRFTSSGKAIDKTRATGMERALNEYRTRQATGGGDQQPANLGTDGQGRAAGTNGADLPANRAVSTNTPPTAKPVADANVEPTIAGSPAVEKRGDAGTPAPGAREIETPAGTAREQGLDGTQGANGERGAGAAAPENAARNTRTGELGAAGHAGQGDTGNAAPAGSGNNVTLSPATEAMLREFPGTDRMRARLQYLRTQALADEALAKANGDVVTAYSNLLRDKSLGLDPNYSRAITHALVEKFNATPPTTAREKANAQAAEILHDSTLPMDAPEPTAVPLREAIDRATSAPETWQKLVGKKYRDDFDGGMKYLTDLVDKYQSGGRLTPRQKSTIETLREQGVEIAEPLTPEQKAQANITENARGFTPEQSLEAPSVRTRKAIDDVLDNPNMENC